MKTIRTIFQGGSFKPLDPVDLPENTPLTVALLDSDDVPADALARLAQEGKAFDFLGDPREEVYSEADGEPLHDR